MVLLLHLGVTEHCSALGTPNSSYYCNVMVTPLEVSTEHFGVMRTLTAPVTAPQISMVANLSL